MTKFLNSLTPSLSPRGRGGGAVIRNLNLDIVWNLACLREPHLSKPCAAGRRFGEGRCL